LSGAIACAFDLQVKFAEFFRLPFSNVTGNLHPSVKRTHFFSPTERSGVGYSYVREGEKSKMALKITEPQNEAELSAQKEITFKGTADNSINKVEVYADDRWLIGRTQADNGNWSLSYPFNTSGHREIVAKGFNSDNQLIASDEIWIFIKKASIDLTIQLTDNFQLWELVKSDTADRKNIDNTPTPREIEHLRKLCKQILQPARDALGAMKITSGFRSEDLNRFVGGVSNSDHRQGYAADIIPVNAGTRAFAEWVAKNCEFDQIILEFGTSENPNWIHVSAAPRNRKIVLRATSGRDETIYTNITNHPDFN
jgi:hypothetical protein